MLIKSLCRIKSNCIRGNIGSAKESSLLFQGNSTEYSARNTGTALHNAVAILFHYLGHFSSNFIVLGKLSSITSERLLQIHLTSHSLLHSPSLSEFPRIFYRKISSRSHVCRLDRQETLLRSVGTHEGRVENHWTPFATAAARWKWIYRG